MAQAARTLDPVDLPVHCVALPAQVVSVGDGAIEWSQSPARALHEQLLQSFGAQAPARDDRLPLRLRLAAIGAAVATPWIALGAAWSLIA